MSRKENDPQSESFDRNLVLSSLEYDQLVKAKSQPIPLRHLKDSQVAILWALRVYLLIMMAVVVYQVWSVAR